MNGLENMLSQRMKVIWIRVCCQRAIDKWNHVHAGASVLYLSCA